MRHVPVLLQEVLQGLNLSKGDVYVDCNLGDGGHAEAVIESLQGDVTVAGFDLDQAAIDRARANIEKGSAAKDGSFDAKRRLHLFRKNFRSLEDALSKAGLTHSFDGEIVPIADAILFDFGISSYELEESGRGFSFQRDEPLSMTFGKASGEDKDHAFTAYDIVNSWQEENIADIIYGYGEDKFSRRIARGIVEAREALKKDAADAGHDKTKAVDDIASEEGGIRTTAQLADIIRKAYPSFARHGKIHPATRTFQALRIAVNDELRSIEDALPQAMRVLKPGGRLAVISFHSLEDRIVKRFFKAEAEEGRARLITKKPLTPSEEETRTNPRSRSSKLRILEKTE